MILRGTGIILAVMSELELLVDTGVGGWQNYDGTHERKHDG